MTVHAITTLAAGFVSGLDNTVDPTAHSDLSLVQVSSILVGTVLPILVALVSTRLTSRAAKSWLLAALSAVSGFLTEFINSGDDFVWQQAVLTTVVTFVVAVATYYGLWNPTGISTRALDTGRTAGGGEGGYVAAPSWVVVVVIVVAVVVILAILF